MSCLRLPTAAWQRGWLREGLPFAGVGVGSVRGVTDAGIWCVVVVVFVPPSLARYFFVCAGASVLSAAFATAAWESGSAKRCIMPV